MFERFTKPARAVVETAFRQSEEDKAGALGIEHLYFGVVTHAGEELSKLFAELGITADGVRRDLQAKAQDAPLGDLDAEALKSIGIDLDSVRSSLDATFGEGSLDREPPKSRARFPWLRSRVTDGGKKVLELSLREAIRLKSKEIRVEHLLLGILRAPNANAQAMIEQHIAINSLRERVEMLITRAA